VPAVPRPDERRALVEGAVAGAVFLVVALLVTWPMVLNPFGRVFGPFNDSAGAIADLGNWSIHGFSLFGSQWVDWLGAPIGFWQSDLLNITAIVLVAPALIITEVAGSVLAYNTIIIAGLVMPAVMTYVVVRWIGAGMLPGVWAGLVTLLVPFHVEASADWFSVGHITMVPAAIIAVAWWGLRPSWRRAFLIFGVLLVAFFTNAYTGLIVLVTAMCALIGWVLFPGRAVSIRQRLLAVTRPLALVVVAMVPVVALGVHARSAVGERPIEYLYSFHVDAWQYLTPSDRSPVYADLLGGPTGLRTGTATLFLGFLTIALAITGLAAPRSWAPLRRDRSTPVIAASVIVVVVSIIFTHSRPFSIFGVEVPSPSELIFRVAPTFRAFDRFVLAAAVGLAIVGAVGLARVRSRAPARWGATIALGAIAITCAELWIRPVAQSPPITTPAWAEALREQDPRGPAVVYPLELPDSYLGYRLRYAQMKVGVPLLNGAPVGSQADRVLNSMPDPADPSTIERLHALGIRSVVVTDGIRPPGTTAVARAADGTVYAIRGPRPPAAAFYVAGYPPEGEPGDLRARWLQGPTAVEVIANRRACVRISLTAASYGPIRYATFGPGQGRAPVRVTADRTELSVTTRIAPGALRVGLSSTPGPIQVSGETRRVSLYVSEPRVTELQASKCRG